MQITKILFLIALLFTQTFSVWSQQKKELFYTPVSLINLIANPEKYDGKPIRVEGILHHEFEDSALYFSKVDADHLNLANAIWINYDRGVKVRILVCQQYKDITEPKLNDFEYFHGRYVAVEGVFKMSGHGHLGAFSGELENVVSLVEQRQWYDGNKKVVETDKDGRFVSKANCQ